MMALASVMTNEHFHAQGAKAKARGFGRTSPYYEDERADLFFFAGFDGVTYEEAAKQWNELMSKVACSSV